MEGAWNPAVAQLCIAQTKFYYGNAIANLLTDVIILCLPLPLIWRLNMTTHKKTALSGVFLLRGLYDSPSLLYSLALTYSHSVCVSSILRIVSLGDIDDKDITCMISHHPFTFSSHSNTDTLVTTGVWTSVETPLVIVCACLPTLPVYFKAWYQKMTMSPSKGTKHAPFLQSLRSKTPTSELAPGSSYQNLNGREATPLSDISLAKRNESEEDHVGLDQIHVSH